MKNIRVCYMLSLWVCVLLFYLGFFVHLFRLFLFIFIYIRFYVIMTMVMVAVDERRNKNKKLTVVEWFLFFDACRQFVRLLMFSMSNSWYYWWNWLILSLKISNEIMTMAKIDFRKVCVCVYVCMCVSVTVWACLDWIVLWTFQI